MTMRVYVFPRCRGPLQSGPMRVALVLGLGRLQATALTSRSSETGSRGLVLAGADGSEVATGGPAGGASRSVR